MASSSDELDNADSSSVRNLTHLTTDESAKPPGPNRDLVYSELFEEINRLKMLTCERVRMRFMVLPDLYPHVSLDRRVPCL